jgi:uncharacterized protein YndB with AHSA1/START domain
MQNEKNDREIVSSRLFNVPRTDLFMAFKDSTMLARWWGPEGFTNVFHLFEFRTGGTWKFTMISPDGNEFHNTNIFGEIIENEKIDFDHIEPIHSFRFTALFTDEEQGTRLTFNMLFDSVEEYERVQAYITDANEQNFKRLQQALIQ